MQFRSEFFPKPFTEKIKYTDQILLAGSCFTEQIGRKLAAHKFNVLENPHGILFNPISIAKAVKHYTEKKVFSPEDLFYFNELWASRDHHTGFSNPDKDKALSSINDAISEAAAFIKKAEWLILTFGSAFLYEWKNIKNTGNYENAAANCHKIPTDKFNRKLLTAEEIIFVLQEMKDEVRKINPGIKLIYTISPVRHLREGFIENNRSKAALIQAVHYLTNNTDVFYFPSYELVIDDLRDYRFFAEDLVHPNYAATNYVWEKFISVAVDETATEVIKEVKEINTAVNHKPFNPASEGHKKFLSSYLNKTRLLAHKYPGLNFETELRFFSVGSG